MTTNYREELDFRLMFGESSYTQLLGHPESRSDDDATCYPLFPPGPHHPTEQQESCTNPSYGTPHPGSLQPMESPSRVFDCPSIQITSIPANCHQDLGAHQLDQSAGACGEASAGSLSRDQLFLPLDASYRDTSSLCPSPCSSLSSRSWLSDASSCESFSHIYDDVEAELNEAAAQVRLASPLVSPLASPLPSPLTSPQASPQVSPLVSPFGSPGCMAAYGDDPWYRYQQHHQQPLQYHCAQSLSPYQSPRTSITEETWLSPRPHSSSSRPSSRPTSPCGKRRHSSAEVIPGLASPHLSPNITPSHSPRESVTEETWMGGATFAPYQTFPLEVDIPSKTRRTYQTNHNQDQVALLPGQEDSSFQDPGLANPSLNSGITMFLPSLKKEDMVEHFLAVPTHFPWVKPKQVSTPLYRSTSLPPLDCHLPSQCGQCELKMEIQPKPHHRAHYETEGSRGAIKSDCGRHPVVKLIGYNEKPVSLQMFIGTADERYTRPHPFYQVHRITGKTVATPSQETVISSTKVLEIPLLPENNMCTSIDCAGILKLRNSDIELRKGETDIGRKNTRVRAVFRVHIPQHNGKVLSLQVASMPIECSQRLSQELPQIESFSPACGSVNGGEEMLITGQNINPESTVVFQEKSSDGKTQWEVDVRALQEKSQNVNTTSIVVKIPPYYKKTTASSTQVQFYVSNGKRKRSASQFFTYLSVQVKQEFGLRADLNTNELGGQHPTTSPAGLFTTRDPLASDEVQPLEQWLLSEGTVCAPSSTHLSYSPQDPFYLSRSHPAERSLNAEADLHPMFHPSLVDFNNSFYQKPQQDLSYKEQPSLPMVGGSLQGCKSSQILAEQPRSQLGKGYQGIPTEHSQNLHNLGPVSVSNTSVLTSPNVDTSGLHTVDPVQFPQAPSSQVLPLSHQPTLAKVPSNSPSISESLMDPQPLGASLQEPSKSYSMSQDGEHLHIKQEPEEEKELAFQSIGLQDITLDDVSEIIVRDLFETPDSGSANSLL
ncbi:nuclear factor of activated T-cells, cytoplasmic 3 isoform X2 [Sinocyclocheilus rhinocerous]|uniref:nuclear factor of activated T-cells, cytoplasmic 3 isoform X2 n=1 Tax=Sinocyclocheilus rhinocerous TaxID=307959 RepID=UPI0007BA2B5F|nr:PREDICTED: nuclear factor of activated T-cells, cytoplasmic 3-like isoform X2 [Sinocyclocheilus rhinocerous]